MRKTFLTLSFFFFSFLLFGQDKVAITEQDYKNDQVEMADQFRADGKIYVLTGIILIILAGTITYLVSIDRKVGRLEKQLGNKGT
ncbi:CcmD family protein [Fulvivirga sp. M361]|uniref:CcmD family protein n=1 Tax=Fulvivirga sp. M361 TaxID=2594266 RepID=UPI00117A89A1|nr:CcmD family protein [Fulvivirga sp. M361]TRX50959.1 CcmD family protein [Fulvivirga sp. M361]